MLAMMSMCDLPDTSNSKAPIFSTRRRNKIVWVVDGVTCGTASARSLLGVLAATLLTIRSGLFYVAERHQIGSRMCHQANRRRFAGVSNAAFYCGAGFTG